MADNCRMRWASLLLAVSATGCSFFLVKGPSQRVDVIGEGADRKCTETSIVPVVDVAGGLAAAAAAVGGVILEQTSDDGEPENFGKYYAGPLVVASIVYFVAASRGNSRTTWCSDMKDRIKAGEGVRPNLPPPPTSIDDLTNDKPPKEPQVEQEGDKEDPNKKK